jgi:hypothetical protein
MCAIRTGRSSSGKAATTSTVETENWTPYLESRDVLMAGDSVVIFLDLATKRPLTAEVGTNVDGSPVTLDVTCGSIERGPDYPSISVTTTQWKGFKVSVVTQNSGYVRRGS